MPAWPEGIDIRRNTPETRARAARMTVAAYAVGISNVDPQVEAQSLEWANAHRSSDMDLDAKLASNILAHESKSDTSQKVDRLSLLTDVASTHPQRFGSSDVSAVAAGRASVSRNSARLRVKNIDSIRCRVREEWKLFARHKSCNAALEAGTSNREVASSVGHVHTVHGSVDALPRSERESRRFSARGFLLHPIAATHLDVMHAFSANCDTPSDWTYTEILLCVMTQVVRSLPKSCGGLLPEALSLLRDRVRRHDIASLDDLLPQLAIALGNGNTENSAMSSVERGKFLEYARNVERAYAHARIHHHSNRVRIEDAKLVIDSGSQHARWLAIDQASSYKWLNVCVPSRLEDAGDIWFKVQTVTTLPDETLLPTGERIDPVLLTNPKQLNVDVREQRVVGMDPSTVRRFAELLMSYVSRNTRGTVADDVHERNAMSIAHYFIEQELLPALNAVVFERCGTIDAAEFVPIAPQKAMVGVSWAPRVEGQQQEKQQEHEQDLEQRRWQCATAASTFPRGGRLCVRADSHSPWPYRFPAFRMEHRCMLPRPSPRALPSLMISSMVFPGSWSPFNNVFLQDGTCRRIHGMTPLSAYGDVVVDIGDKADESSQSMCSSVPEFPSESVAILIRAVERIHERYAGCNRASSVSPPPSLSSFSDEQACMLTMSTNLLSNLRQRGANGASDALIVDKGRGVVCIAPHGFGSDEFVGEYTGELMLPREFQELVDSGKEPRHFVMLDRHVDSPKGFDILFVVADNCGQFTSRITHSCDPNCVAVTLAHHGQLRVCIFTTRVVACGEELSLDLASWQDDERSFMSAVCPCGMARCRGHCMTLLNSAPMRVFTGEYIPFAARLVHALEGCMGVCAFSDQCLLGQHGIANSVLGSLPRWVMRFCARQLAAITDESYSCAAAPHAHLGIDRAAPPRATASHTTPLDVGRALYQIRMRSLVYAIDRIARYNCKSDNAQSASGELFGVPPQHDNNDGIPLVLFDHEQVVDYLWRHPHHSVCRKLVRAVNCHNSALASHLLTVLFPPKTTATGQFISSLLRQRQFAFAVYEIKTLMGLAIDVLSSHEPTNGAYTHAAADMLHLVMRTELYFALNMSSQQAHENKSGEVGQDAMMEKFNSLAAAMMWTRPTAKNCADAVKRRLHGAFVLPLIESCFSASPQVALAAPYGVSQRQALLHGLMHSPWEAWPSTDRGAFWRFPPLGEHFVIGSPMLDGAICLFSLQLHGRFVCDNRLSPRFSPKEVVSRTIIDELVSRLPETERTLLYCDPSEIDAGAVAAKLELHRVCI